MVDQLSVKQAADRVGVTIWAVHKAVESGRLAALSGSPLRLDPAEVERFRLERHTAALQRLAARGVDLTQLAHDTRAFLQPSIGAPAGGWDAVGKLGQDVIAVYGAVTLRAAAMPGDTCKWCAATVLSELWGAPAPVFSTATVALLGRPCPRDVERMAGTTMAELRARVGAPAVRPPQARTAPSAGKRPAVSPAPALRAVTAAAQPSQRSALADQQVTVTRRVELQAALGRALRTNDHKYAAQLRHLIRAL